MRESINFMLIERFIPGAHPDEEKPERNSRERKDFSSGFVVRVGKWRSWKKLISDHQTGKKLKNDDRWEQQIQESNSSNDKKLIKSFFGVKGRG